MPKFKTNENNITVILRMKSYSVTILMKPTEQYLPVVLFTRQVLTFDFVEEIIKRDHLNLMKPSPPCRAFQ